MSGFVVRMRKYDKKGPIILEAGGEHGFATQELAHRQAEVLAEQAGPGVVTVIEPKKAKKHHKKAAAPVAKAANPRGSSVKASIAAAAGKHPDDVHKGWVTDGAGPARFGWYYLTPSGSQRFLGKTLADVKKQKAREGFSNPKKAAKKKPTLAQSIAEVVGKHTADIGKGWVLDGPGPARFGWFYRSPSGKENFLGKTLADVKKHAERYGNPKQNKRNPAAKRANRRIGAKIEKDWNYVTAMAALRRGEHPQSKDPKVRAVIAKAYDKLMDDAAAGKYAGPKAKKAVKKKPVSRRNSADSKPDYSGLELTSSAGHVFSNIRTVCSWQAKHQGTAPKISWNDPDGVRHYANVSRVDFDPKNLNACIHALETIMIAKMKKKNPGLRAAAMVAAKRLAPVAKKVARKALPKAKAAGYAAVDRAVQSAERTLKANRRKKGKK